MKGSGCIFCTVLLWIGSVLPLFLVREGVLLFVHLEHTIAELDQIRVESYFATNITVYLELYRLEVHYQYYPKPPPPPPGPGQIIVYANGRVDLQLSRVYFAQVVLGVSMAVFVFCLHSLRVVRSKCFEGKSPQHDIATGGGC